MGSFEHGNVVDIFGGLLKDVYANVTWAWWCCDAAPVQSLRRKTIWFNAELLYNQKHFTVVTQPGLPDANKRGHEIVEDMCDNTWPKRISSFNKVAKQAA